MKDQLERIRRLLDDIETQHESGPFVEMAGFHALDLPAVIQEIVDDLQPLMSPYEAAFYWYAFRHSIGTNGSPICQAQHKKTTAWCREIIPFEREQESHFGAEVTSTTLERIG